MSSDLSPADSYIIAEDPEVPRPPPPRRAGFLDWLPVLLTAPFLVLFLVTVMPRLGVPFELEWNEGQTAEQAWRFAHGMALYPAPESGWVPYMYAPLYHIVYGTVMKLTGVYTLGMGRLISFMASVATAIAIFMIVWDRARRAVPPLFAACLYFAYFKPSGYWYDLVRVDALAFALCAWGMYLTLKRNVAFWQGALGLLLLLAGSLTKQNVAPVAIYCAVVLLFKNPRALLLGGVVVAIALANFLFLFERAGNEDFYQYVWQNALNHPSRAEVYFPGGQTEQQFLAKVPEPKSAVQKVSTYIHQAREMKVPDVWRECGRHVWIFDLLIGAWCIVALARRRLPEGWLYIIPATLLAAGSMGAYAKFGGYVNNFVSLFMGICILSGLALNGLGEYFEETAPLTFSALASLLIFLQLFQPWSVPPVTDGESNYGIIRWVSDKDFSDKLWAYAGRLSDAKKGVNQGLVISEPVSPRVKYYYQVSRFIYPGLAWNPIDQWPRDSSFEAYHAMMDFLRWKKSINEPVWLVHHQWFALLVDNSAMVMNPDMVRCAQWAGDPTPPQLARNAGARLFRWIIIDTPNVRDDWMPGELQQAITKNYESLGVVPFIDRSSSTGPLTPLTGAEKWPFEIFREQGFTGKLRNTDVFEGTPEPGFFEMGQDSPSADKIDKTTTPTLDIVR